VKKSSRVSLLEEAGYVLLFMSTLTFWPVIYVGFVDGIQNMTSYLIMVAISVGIVILGRQFRLSSGVDNPKDD
jgi:hypothetical protein